jgi:hypothetical protein
MTGFVKPVLATLVLVLAAPAGLAQQTRPADEIVAVVTALSPDSTITLGEEPATIGSTAGLYPGEPLRVEVKGGTKGAREVMLRIDALATNLLAAGTTIGLELGDGRALTIHPQLGTDGLLDVYHDADSPPLTVQVGDTAIRVARGVVRVRAASDGQVEILCASGSAAIAAGAAKIALESAGKNRVSVRGTSLSEESRVEVARDITATRSRIVQQSLLRDLVRVAESAAEGDIEPPARGSAVPITAIAAAVRVADIVPRGGGPTSFSGAAAQGSNVAGQSASTAEAFLSSGQAALAVVGARIQATRVVGGAPGRAPLGVNNQLRRRFTLGAAKQ